MGRWTIVLNVYNEVDHIADVVRSFGNKVEKILVVDGAYSYYPYKHFDQKPYSTDGTLDAVGRVMADFVDTEIEFVEVKTPWEGETAKKNHAIKNYDYEEGDYIFFVDGHEILEGDLKAQQKVIEEEEWEIGRVVVYDPSYWKKAELIESFHYEAQGQWRILRWHQDLHLKKKHWNFVVQKIPLVRSIPVKSGNCKLMKLAHFKRSSKREYIRDLHKHAFGPDFHWHEEAYLAYRKLRKIEDGEIG